MSKFCEQCNAPIGFFSRKRVTLPDGTRRVLCRACAAEPTATETSSAAPPSPAASAGRYREAAHVQEPSGDEDQLERLERARRNDPQSEDVLDRLGRLSLRMAQRSTADERASHLKRAGACFRALLLIHGAETSPSRKAETFVGLATVSELEGDYAKAKAMAGRAIDVDERYQPARDILARLNNNAG